MKLVELLLCIVWVDGYEGNLCVPGLASWPGCVIVKCCFEMWLSAFKFENVMKCLQQIPNAKRVTFPVVVLTLCSLRNIITFYPLLMFKEAVTYFSCGGEELLVNFCRQTSSSLYTFLSLVQVTKIISGLWKFSLRVGVTFWWLAACITDLSVAVLFIFSRLSVRKNIILTFR